MDESGGDDKDATTETCLIFDRSSAYIDISVEAAIARDQSVCRRELVVMFKMRRREARLQIDNPLPLGPCTRH